MANRFWGRAGGILGLLELLDDDKKSLALEADLIRSGLRLRDVGSEEFSWRDLKAFITGADQNSAIARALHPEEWMWNNEAMLLASAVDTLRVIAWQKTRDGSKGRNAPAPIPRPGVVPTTRKTTGKAVPMNELRSKLNAMYRTLRTSHTGPEQKRVVRSSRKKD